MRARPIIPILCLGVVCVLGGRLNAQSVTHVVRAHETIYSIAKDYKIAPELLMRANGISNPRFLRVGTVLRIPSAYRVKRGDTFYGISRQFDVSVSQILKLNDFTASHMLREGETILIPVAGSAAATPGVASISGGGSAPDATHGAPAVSSGAQTGGDAQRDSVIDASAFESRVSGDEAVKLPVSVDASPVDPSSDGPWPHPGKHYLLSGKFPGIMIKGKPGDPVTAVAGGRVIYTGPYTTFGRVVFVQSPDGFVYIYGGNGKVLVSPGDTVQSGTTIGSLGTIPFGEGAEVYFSVWKHNKFVDPEKAPRG